MIKTFKKLEAIQKQKVVIIFQISIIIFLVYISYLTFNWSINMMYEDAVIGRNETINRNIDFWEKKEYIYSYHKELEVNNKSDISNNNDDFELIIIAGAAVIILLAAVGT